MHSFKLTSRAARFSVLVVITALVLLAFGIGQARAAGEPTCMATGMEQISTDQADYAPGSTVQISGVGFNAACDVNLNVNRPDGVVETVTASTDPLDGSFSTSYVLPPLPGVIGTYAVDAIGTAGILASTTFTDATITIRSPNGSSTNQNGNASTQSFLSMSRPSGTQAGDLLVAQITYNGGSNTFINSAPSGWTEITGLTNSNGTSVGQRIYWKVAATAASDPGPYVWTIGNNFGNPPRMSGGIAAYAGVDTSNPIDASATTTGSTTTTYSAPSVTTTVANDRVINFFGPAASNSNSTVTTGTTLVFNVQNSNGPSSKAQHFAQASAGSTGSKSISTQTSSNYIAHTVALRPSATITLESSGTATDENGDASGTSWMKIDPPSATQVGDLLIAQVTYNGGSNSTIGAPAGWTEITGLTNNNSSNVGQRIYWRVAGGFAENVWTIFNNSGNTPRMSGGMAAYVGVDPTNPVDDSASTSPTSNSTYTAPSVTTTVANDRVINFFGSDGNNNNNTVTSGTVLVFNTQNSSGSGPSTKAQDFTQASAGSTGSKAISSQASTDYVAHTVALQPTNTAPTDPTSLAQFQSDGSTAIATGGIASATSVVLKGSVSDPDGNQVQLQVEVKPVGTAFDGTGTVTGGLVTSGQTASATVSGLTRGTNYHWRARTVDSNGGASAWVSYPSASPNSESATDFSVTQVPADASSLAQFQSDATTAIATGAGALSTSVVLKATVSDPDLDQVQLQVEVKSVGTSFNGTSGFIDRFLCQHDAE